MYTSMRKVVIKNLQGSVYTNRVGWANQFRYFRQCMYQKLSKLACSRQSYCNYNHTDILGPPCSYDMCNTVLH